MNELENRRNGLAERFPRKVISVGCQAFYNGHALHLGGKSQASWIYTEYVISVQPGFDGTDVQNFGGNDLAECLNKFNTAAEGAK